MDDKSQGRSNVKSYRAVNAVFTEQNGPYMGRSRVWNEVHIVVTDNEGTMINVTNPDRGHTFYVDGEADINMETGEISFSSRGVQYRITPERAAKTQGNPPSDTMQKDQ